MQRVEHVKSLPVPLVLASQTVAASLLRRSDDPCRTAYARAGACEPSAPRAARATQMPTPATALAEQDDLTRSVGLCGVSVTATCKQCDGAEAREARGARRRLLWRVAGLRLPAPLPTSPARAQVRAASGTTRSQRASPVPLVQRVRPSRSLLVEGSGWQPAAPGLLRSQRVNHDPCCWQWCCSLVAPAPASSSWRTAHMRTAAGTLHSQRAPRCSRRSRFRQPHLTEGLLQTAIPPKLFRVCCLRKADLILEFIRKRADT